MSENEVYTLIYKASCTYKDRGTGIRRKIVRGNVISADLFRKLPKGIRRNFVQGRVSREQAAEIISSRKGVVPGERDKGGYSRNINFATGEPEVREAEAHKGPEIPELPKFGKITKDDVIAWAARQDWIPPELIGDKTKKVLVADIRNLHRRTFLEPEETEPEAEPVSDESEGEADFEPV